MPGIIFLNYRRGDDAGTVGRLFDRMEPAFGKERLFMDVEGHIKAGDDYVDKLRAQVAGCDVLLAIIGPRWLSIADAGGRRRLDNPEDWVRIEIVSALEAGANKRVIPVLVGGAAMPRAEDLPDALAPLARRQAVRLTLERFNADAQGLISQVTAVLADLEAARAAGSAERAAAEKVRVDREAAEAARLAAVEARGREQRKAGLSAEEIRKAEELANWDFIKVRSDIEELRDHLARFPGGVTQRYAQARLEELAWAALGTVPEMKALRAYLEAYPKADAAVRAREQLAERERVAAMAAEEARVRRVRDRQRGLEQKEVEARLRERANVGRFSRRALIAGIGLGVAGTAGLGGAAYATFVPGMPVWRILNDQSARTFTGHTETVTAVAILPGGLTAISGSWDQTIRLWDLATGRELGAFPAGMGIHQMSVSVDGKTALVGGPGPTAKLFDLENGNELHAFTGRSGYATQVALSADGLMALCANTPGVMTLWDVTKGTELRTFTGHAPGVDGVALSGNGVYALSGNGDKTLSLWSTANGNELRTFAGHTESVWSVTFSKDSHTILSGSADKTLRHWDTETGRVLHTLVGHTGAVVKVAMSADGLRAVSSGADFSVRLWDLTAGTGLRTFSGHAGIVTGVAISPDGKTALSGSYDATLKLWDLTG